MPNAAFVLPTRCRHTILRLHVHRMHNMHMHARASRWTSAAAPHRANVTVGARAGCGARDALLISFAHGTLAVLRYSPLARRLVTVQCVDLSAHAPPAWRLGTQLAADLGGTVVVATSAQGGVVAAYFAATAADTCHHEVLLRIKQLCAYMRVLSIERAGAAHLGCNAGVMLDRCMAFVNTMESAHAVSSAPTATAQLPKKLQVCCTFPHTQYRSTLTCTCAGLAGRPVPQPCIRSQ